MRIGHGYDVHAFCDGDHIRLGGVDIPHDRALKAHSDGDVLLHALCDALLGAIAAGDIGHHFPDDDESYRGIDSVELLKRVIEMVHERNFELSNADMTIIAQAPKISPYIETMRETIASALSTDTGSINIKATTTERLGYIGRKEGIACHAIVLLEER